MSDKGRSIEVDEGTAAALESRAAERGVSVSQVVAELVPLAVDSETIAELDRRWAAIEAGEPTVPHEDVVRWLKTWGTPAFKDWSNAALADLDRFANFLEKDFPALAQGVAEEIIEKAQLIGANPRLGRAIEGHAEYRQIVLRVLNAPYVFQYRHDGTRLVILRVFHGREDRK